MVCFPVYSCINGDCDGDTFLYNLTHVMLFRTSMDRWTVNVELDLHQNANRTQMWHVKTMRTFDVVHLYVVWHSPRQRIDPAPRLLN